MKLTIPFFALSLLVLSCKKDNPAPPSSSDQSCDTTFIYNYTNDTVFPSDFLMAYPGSWWEYDNGEVDSCTSWEAVPWRVVTNSDGCVFVNEDQKILPKGMLYAEYIANDHSLWNAAELNSTTFTPIIDTIIGVFSDYTTYSGTGMNAYSDHRTRELVDRIDSMVLGSYTYYDVLHVKYVWDINMISPVYSGPKTIRESWYAKNVGLIKWTTAYNGSIYEDVELVNHYIAPH